MIPKECEINCGGGGGCKSEVRTTRRTDNLPRLPRTGDWGLMAPHSSVLAWRIPGTGEPGGLPSMGSHRVGHD